MDYYPPQFSGQARANVEREQLKASRDLANSRREKPPADWTGTAREWDRWEFYDYIIRVFVVFAHEACALGRAGLWTIDRVRSEAEEFLRRFTLDACYDKGNDRSGQK